MEIYPNLANNRRAISLKVFCFLLRTRSFRNICVTDWDGKSRNEKWAQISDLIIFEIWKTGEIYDISNKLEILLKIGDFTKNWEKLKSDRKQSKGETFYKLSIKCKRK